MLSCTLFRSSLWYRGDSSARLQYRGWGGCGDACWCGFRCVWRWLDWGRWAGNNVFGVQAARGKGAAGIQGVKEHGRPCHAEPDVLGPGRCMGSCSWSACPGACCCSAATPRGTLPHQAAASARRSARQPHPPACFAPRSPSTTPAPRALPTTLLAPPCRPPCLPLTPAAEVCRHVLHAPVERLCRRWLRKPAVRARRAAHPLEAEPPDAVPRIRRQQRQQLLVAQARRDKQQRRAARAARRPLLDAVGAAQLRRGLDSEHRVLQGGRSARSARVRGRAPPQAGARMRAHAREEGCNRA